MNKEISQCYIKSLFNYDKLSGVITFRYNRKPLSTVLSSGYLVARLGNETFMSHRIAWVISNGMIPDGMEIDHIDGNRLNNRIENLRLVSHSGNMKNVGIKRSNTSGITGVTITKDGSYRARVRSNGVYILDVRCTTIEEAAELVLKVRRDNGFTDRHGF
jgi:hypothetical protein